jgi:hypothetical protein
MGIFEWIFRRGRRGPAAGGRGRSSPVAEAKPANVPLERQLALLAELGLPLDDGVTVDDLLYSFDREDYEAAPYDLVLFVLGSEIEREPWGRAFCSRVWNFDPECIEGPGDYAKIVRRLAKLAGGVDYVRDVKDEIDVEQKRAWVEYVVNGRVRKLTARVDDDWCDDKVLAKIMRDVERDESRFFVKEDGQAMVLVYLPPAHAERIKSLAGGPALELAAAL